MFPRQHRAGASSDSEAGDDLFIEHEALEDNEELRLHILGLQSYWTQHLFLQNMIG